MFGMVSVPVDTALATEEPEIMPNMAEEATQTLAGPPVKRPARIVERSTNSWPSPMRCATVPNSTKWKTTVATTQRVTPKMPSAGK